MLFRFLRNTRPVIRYDDMRHIVLPVSTQGDVGAFWRILDRIIHQIHEYSLDQLCIHRNHEHRVIHLHGNMMIRQPPAQPGYRRAEQIIQQLGRHFEVLLIRLQLRGNQQVFCHVDKPIGVVMDQSI